MVTQKKLSDYGIPSNFATRHNCPIKLQKKLGAYVFETPVTELDLKHHTIKKLVNILNVYSLYELLTKYKSYFGIDGIGVTTIKDIHVVLDKYQDEKQVIRRFNLSLDSPVSELEEYLCTETVRKKFKEQTKKHIDPDVFRRLSTIQDFLLFDRWDQLALSVRKSFLPSFFKVKMIQDFVMQEMELSESDLPLKHSQSKVLVSKEFLNNKTTKEINEMTVREFSDFSDDISDRVYDEKEKRIEQVRAKNVITIAVDEQLISGLEIFSRINYWTHWDQEEGYQKYVQDPNSCYSFWNFLHKEPNALKKFLEHIEYFVSTVKKMRSYTLKYEIKEEFNDVFYRDKFGHLTFPSEKYRNNQKMGPLSLDNIFNGYPILYIGLWKATVLMILYQDKEGLNRVKELSAFCPNKDIRLSWDLLYQCFDAWSNLTNLCAVGDTFKTPSIYKTLGINGIVFKRIIRFATNLGILKVDGNQYLFLKTRPD